MERRQPKGGQKRNVPTTLEPRQPNISLDKPDLSVTMCNATMTNTRRARLRTLGDVEQLVMEHIWSQASATAEAVREGLTSRRPMKDSTVRTGLRRLGEKGYPPHRGEGRTYGYPARRPRTSGAPRAGPAGAPAPPRLGPCRARKYS